MRLIDADALKAWFFRPYSNEESYCNMDVAKAIDDAPTIDAVPVRHGEWIHSVAVQGTTSGGVTYYHGYTCSVCGGLMGRKGDAYCYNCGARMDGERRES